MRNATQRHNNLKTSQKKKKLHPIYRNNTKEHQIHFMEGMVEQKMHHLVQEATKVQSNKLSSFHYNHYSPPRISNLETITKKIFGPFFDILNQGQLNYGNQIQKSKMLEA